MGKYLTNGCYVKRKPEDECPPNYKPDKQDPLICRPDVPCIFGPMEMITENCCKPYEAIVCSKFKRIVKEKECLRCILRQAPP